LRIEKKKKKKKRKKKKSWITNDTNGTNCANKEEKKKKRYVTADGCGSNPPSSPFDKGGKRGICLPELRLLRASIEEKTFLLTFFSYSMYPT
jgi:hypothetical protein